MTEKSYPGSLDPVYSTDSYKGVIVKVYDIFDLIYSEINTLYRLSYSTGGSPPTNPETGNLWLDGSSTPAILKYYNGATWVAVSTGASFGSGIGMDQAVTGFSDRVILQSTGTGVQVYAWAGLPATLYVYDTADCLLQNVSSVSVTLSGAAGLYDIWAQRNGSGTTFTLAFVASGGTPGGGNSTYGQRKIGTAKWSGTAVEAVWSDEVEDRRKYASTEQLFYAYRSAALELDSEDVVGAAGNVIAYDTEYADHQNCFNTSTGVFTADRDGWYEFGSGLYADLGAGHASTNILLVQDMFHSGHGTAVASDRSLGVRIAKSNLVSGPVYMFAGDTMTVKAKQNSGVDNVNIEATNEAGRSKCCFWGRFLGY